MLTVLSSPSLTRYVTSSRELETKWRMSFAMNCVHPESTTHRCDSSEWLLDWDDSRTSEGQETDKLLYR